MACLCLPQSSPLLRAGFSHVCLQLVRLRLKMPRWGLSQHEEEGGRRGETVTKGSQGATRLGAEELPF